MRRLLAAAAVSLVALLGLASAPAQASPGARFGIQDDAWLLDGPGTVDQRLAKLAGLGVGVVRITVRWDEVEPTRGTLDWGNFGVVLDALHAQGMTALVTLAGAPRWANGSSSPWHLPTTGFGAFAAAAAARFPWVRLWTAWNEPNNGMFARPVSPSLYVRDVLNPAYAALHAASPRNLVAGGVTSPRQTPSGMAPLAFMRGIRAARGRLDAYAVNPYPLNPSDTPTRSTCSRCGYFTMAELPQIRADVTRYFGASKPLWLTEYGYQTNPPDQVLGVSPARQALYIGEAALRVWRQPGVTILIQYLLQDEPDLGGWQSGLYTAAGAPKPSARAFPLPLAEESRSGSRVTLWGQVRPGSGARTFELQVARSGGWHTLASGRTTRSGAFSRSIAARSGTRVRLYAPSVGFASPSLTIS